RRSNARCEVQCGLAPACGPGTTAAEPRALGAPPPASAAEVACSGKAPRATWPSAHAPVPAPAVGACVPLSPQSPHPRRTESRAYAILRPPPPPSHLFPFYTQPSTPPLSKRVPGRSSRNRTISIPTFSTRDAQPCLQMNNTAASPMSTATSSSGRSTGKSISFAAELQSMM
ncbi:hypothetical protein MC885_010442, partial [Smutsia gigantea]